MTHHIIKSLADDVLLHRSCGAHNQSDYHLQYEKRPILSTATASVGAL